MTPLILSLALGAAPLSLHLNAVRSEIVVGEPLRLELSWEGRDRVQIPSPPAFGAPAPVEVHIAYASGELRGYREAGPAAEPAWVLPPGDRTEYWDVILHHGTYAPPFPQEWTTLAFRQAGTYQVLVRYRIPVGDAVESNRVTVKVRDPIGEERLVLQSLQDNLRELKYGGPIARELLARYPDNRQLALARAYSASRALRAIIDRQDQGTAESLKALARRLDQERWGVFDDQRLILLAEKPWQLRDEVTRAHALSRLKALYPHSSAHTILPTDSRPLCAQLWLTLPKHRLMVGESTKAVVGAEAVCDVDAPDTGIGLLIDDGSGYRPFVDVEEDEGEALIVRAKTRHRAGTSFRSPFRMAVTGRFEAVHFAFPKPGTYRIQAYWGDVRSNVVSVTAVEPEGEDARVWKELRKAPGLLSSLGVDMKPGEARELVGRSPRSVYLAPVQLLLWQRELWAGPTAAALDAIEAAEPMGAPFEADRLLLVARNRTLMRDEPGALRVYERIAREHPDTPASDQAQAVLREALARPLDRDSYTGVLTLQLRAARDRILVGEAQKLALAWHARQPLEIRPELAKIMIDAGQGYRPYHETSLPEPLMMPPGDRPLKPGEPYRTSYVMAVAGHVRPNGEKDLSFAFPRPGVYRVRAEYSCCPPEERGTVVSNEVVVTVTEPGGSDGKLFRDVLQRRPELLTKWAYAVGLVEPSDLEEIERLLREHEGSPYLGRMRQLYWERRLEDAYRVRGIDALLTEEEKALLRQAEEEPAASDPFHENRLLCAARTGIAWGDYEGAARTYGKLLSAYPDSEAVDEARSWIDRARLEVR